MLTRRTPLFLVALAAATAVVVAGCAQSGTPVAQGHGTTPAHHHAAATTSSTATTSTTQPPVTPIAWSPCNGDLQCGNLVVPLDYAHPDGPTISIAVARHPAEEPAARIGSLVIDPGGPGVSGINDMANELSVLTPQLLDDFDIVMFDPRGVERSDPVTCGTDTGSAPSDPAPVTASQQAATIAGLKQFAAACEKNSATVLPYVGTVDVARDMDRLRQALGDTGLTYMGQSYGTLLGLTYAALFPTHIRAMVLDSVIDPALSFNQITDGTGRRLRGRAQCVLHLVRRQRGLRVAHRQRPHRHAAGAPDHRGHSTGTGGRGRRRSAWASSTTRCSRISTPSRTGRSSARRWPTTPPATGHRPPPSRTSTTRAVPTTPTTPATAIDCLDHPVSHDLATYGALADSLQASAPIFGPLLAWGEAGCAVWPVPPTRTVGPVAAPGSPPILVVGTTNDPATPYAWAVSVAKELDHGVLLTHDGDDHVAYFYSACVRADVQTYLVSGQTPPPGTVCTS